MTREVTGARPDRRGSRPAFAVAVLVASVGGFAGLLASGAGGHRVLDYVDDLVTLAAAALAAMSCLRAGLRHDRGTRRFWILLGIASVAWTAAEGIWSVYELVLHVAPPDPSWADVGYLSAIPLAAGALLSHPALNAIRLRSARALLEGAILATSLLFLSWSFVLGSLWQHTNLSSTAGVVTVAYPFSDVVLVFLAVFAIRSLRGAERLALWSVLAGIVAMAVSDSVYTYFSEKSTFSTGGVIDAGWVAAYLAIALGGYLASSREEVEIHRSTPQFTVASVIVPFLPVLLALSVTAVRTSLGHRIDRTGWLLALVLTVLVLVRQAALLLERALGAPSYGYQLQAGLEADPDSKVSAGTSGTGAR